MNKSDNNHQPNDSSSDDFALAKAKIIAPLVGLRPIPSEKMIEACRKAGELLSLSEGEVSHQTIRNWIKSWKIGGLEGLKRKHKKNRGLTTMSPQLAKIARGILLSSKRFSIAEAHRRLVKYARHSLNLAEDEIPSRKQVMYLWEHISNEEKEFAHEGSVGYRRKYDQSVRFEADGPNSIWQADHHQLDIIVIDPETKKELGRPWITKIQDDFSRAIVGYYLSLDYPSSMSIASALHHAILPKPQDWWVVHGLPKVLYVDNGKDWISRHIELVCAHFGIQHLRHEGYHPQSKGKIERYFRTFEEMCIHPLDGSVGSNIHKRPIDSNPRLTLEQVRVNIVRFIRDYHEKTHTTTKQKPRERWEKNVVDPGKIEDLTKLDYLLKSKCYIVHKYGIHFQNNYYLDKEGLLGGYIGRRVSVFFDSRDTSRIRVWEQDDKGENLVYICTAYCQSDAQHRIKQTTVAEHNRQRRDRVRQSVREQQKEGQKALKVFEEMSEPKTETQIMPPIQEESKDRAETNNSATTTKHLQSYQEPPLDNENQIEPDYEELRRAMQRKQRRGEAK